MSSLNLHQKDIFNIFLLFCCLSFLSPIKIAVAKDFNPFVGIDYQYRNMKDKNDKNSGLQTKNKFKHSLHGADLYIGNIFEEGFAIELGYQNLRHATKITHFSQGEKFGVTENINNKIITETRLKGLRFDLDGFFKLNTNFSLLGQLGFSFIKPSVTAIHTTYSNGATINLLASAKRKFIWHISFGNQIDINSWLGARAVLNWEHTSRLKLNINDKNGNRYQIKSFRNSYTARLGFFIKFV